MSSAQNTVKTILKPHAQTNMYNRGGIYQLKYLDRPLKCVGKPEEHLMSDIKNTFMSSEATKAILAIQTTY
jgi:hypothetical protein